MSHKPGVQKLQVLVVTTASDTDPGSQTAFRHCLSTMVKFILVSVSNRGERKGEKPIELSFFEIQLNWIQKSRQNLLISVWVLNYLLERWLMTTSKRIWVFIYKSKGIEENKFFSKVPIKGTQTWSSISLWSLLGRNFYPHFSCLYLFFSVIMLFDPPCGKGKRGHNILAIPRVNKL